MPYDPLNKLGIESYYAPVPTGDITPLTGVPDWRARLVGGDFYIGDRHYYLFGEKETYTYDECRHTSFTLADFPLSVTGMSVTVEGHAYDNFQVSGQKFSLVHADNRVLAAMWDYTAWDKERLGWYLCGHSFDPNAAIEVTYDYLMSSTTGILSTGTVMQVLNLRDGYDEHFVPTGFTGPIIFTDDCIQPANARDFTPEYSLNPETGELLVNAADNRVLNPAFECIPYENGCPTGIDYYPLGWTFTDPTGIGLLRVPDAYYGRNVVLTQGTGYCLQEVSIDPRLPHSISAFVRGRPRSTGIEACLSVSYVDTSGYIIDPSGIQLGPDTDWSLNSVVTDLTPGPDWERISLSLGDPTSLYPNMDAALPSTVEAMQVKLYSCSTGQVEFDAIQVEVGYAPTQFGFVSPSSTLEIEGNPTGVYQYNIERQAPFNQDDVNLNGAKVEAIRGFMSLGEYSPDWHDEPVGKGGPVVLPVPTGEFVVYRGTGYDPMLPDHQALVAEGPRGYNYHYLQDYTPPDDQTMYALLDVGRTSNTMYEYLGNFTTPGGTNYPGGIANEPWVGPDGVVNLKYSGVSGMDAWADVLKWRIRDLILLGGSCSGVHRFDGIMYYNVNDGAGTDPYTQIPPQHNEMACLIREVHGWAEGQCCPDLLLGIANGTDVIRPEVTDAAWVLSNLDSLLVDGLTITPTADINQNLDRNLIRSKVLHTIDGAADYFNLNFPIYALDYMDLQPTGFIADIIDEVLVAESRHYAYGECWDYYCGPTGLCDVLSITGRVYNYGVCCDDDIPFCTGLGRVHTPWGKRSGYNKLRKRSTFHLDNEPVNEDTTYASNASIPDAIVVLATNSMYADADGSIHVSVPATGTLSVQTIVKDTFGNNVDCERVYANALYGALDNPWQHTNRSGAAEFEYTPAVTGLTGLDCTGLNCTGVDILSFVVRSPDIHQRLLIDQVGCPTGEIGYFGSDPGWATYEHPDVPA